MKKLINIIAAIILAILVFIAIGIVGQADYEYETFEYYHTPKVKISY